MEEVGTKTAKSKKPVKLKLPKKKLTEEEKQARQEAKDLEKALKKSLAEQKKNEKPGQAVKQMVILVPHSLLFKYENLSTNLNSLEINVEGTVVTDCVENVIGFRRDSVVKVMNDLEILVDHIQPVVEDYVVILMYPDEIIPKIHNQLNGLDDTLIERVEILMTIFSGKKITLYFMELDKYFKKQKRVHQQEYRKLVLQSDGDGPPPPKKKANKPTLPEVSQTDLNSALIELQLHTNVDYRVVLKDESLGERLYYKAKAIADAPFKRQKMDSGFDWYALADTAGSIKVDKDGVGLFNLWVEQLMQFATVGIETAKAIATRYPSPRALLTAYENCETLDEGLYLLQNVKVQRGIGPLATMKKIGPEVSKKIYRFFTVRDGDRSLSHSQDT